MSMLTCMANILPELNEDDRPRALYQGLMHVARECAGQGAPVHRGATARRRDEAGGVQELVPQLC